MAHRETAAGRDQAAIAGRRSAGSRDKAHTVDEAVPAPAHPSPPAEPQPGATEESSDQSEGATSATDTSDSDAVDTDQPTASGATVGHDTPPGPVQRGDHRRRRPRSQQALSARDMRAEKTSYGTTLGGGHPRTLLLLLELQLVGFGQHAHCLEHH